MKWEGEAGGAFVNQYFDLGSTTGWKAVAFGPTQEDDGSPANGHLADFENFVADGTTLHTFDETTAGRLSTYVFRVRHRKSTDGGVHWTTSWSTINTSGTPISQGGALTMHGGIEVLPNGDWLMPMYGRRCLQGEICNAATDPTSYTMVIGLLASTDEGRTWSKPTLPFVNASNHYTEATVLRRADGRVIMVGRYDPDFPQSAYLGALVFRVSNAPVNSAADLVGMTWSAPHITVPGIKQIGTLTMGVSPRLTKVGSRIMLTFGRPGNIVAWNYDGTATTWTDVAGLNSNRPTACGSGSHPPCDAIGSSGYVRTAVTDHNAGTGYLIGDRCHVWSCEIPGSDNWPDVTWANQQFSATQAVWLVRFTSG